MVQWHGGKDGWPVSRVIEFEPELKEKHEPLLYPKKRKEVSSTVLNAQRKALRFLGENVENGCIIFTEMKEDCVLIEQTLNELMEMTKTGPITKRAYALALEVSDLCETAGDTAATRILLDMGA